MSHGGESSRISLRTYLWTYAALLVLATLSLLLRVLPVHAYVSVGLGIGFVKAVLVLANFMHLAEEGFGFKFLMVTAAVLVVTLVWLTALDPATRAPYPPPPSVSAGFVESAAPGR